MGGHLCLLIFYPVPRPDRLTTAGTALNTTTSNIKRAISGIIIPDIRDVYA